MNMISLIRREVSKCGIFTINVEQFNQLQTEWITRTAIEPIKVDSPEDIPVLNTEILCWDGCEWDIDYVDHCPDLGVNYMANGTEIEAYLLLPLPPKNEKE